jgi:hypothetical protein
VVLRIDRYLETTAGARLMDRDGAFKHCTRNQHHEYGVLEPLAWSTPPPELYDPLTYGA